VRALQGAETVMVCQPAQLLKLAVNKGVQGLQDALASGLGDVPLQLQGVPAFEVSCVWEG